jgi:hypothetical protein
MGWSIAQKEGQGKAGVCTRDEKVLCKIKVKSPDFTGFP